MSTNETPAADDLAEALRLAAEATEADERDDAALAGMSDALMTAKVQQQAAGGHEALVRLDLQRLRARAEAGRLFQLETQGPPAPLDIATGAELARRALAAPAWRVVGLLPAEGSTLVTAQRKTGKTTWALNLARCLLTGEPFLGEFVVTPVAGTIGLLNFEVSGPQLARWAAEAGVPLERIVIANLRGRRNPLVDQHERQELAAAFRSAGVEVLIVDPFANAFDGDSQNDAGQVARFLHSLSTFTRAEVGATDLVLTNHAGWDGSRTRGSSALEDWGDSLVKLTADAYGARYMSAIGRDVDVPEGRLLFDEGTRRLTIDRSANRAMTETTARLNELVSSVVEQVTTSPGLGVRGLREQLKAAHVSFRNEDVSAALDIATSRGLLEVRTEARNKRAAYPATAPQDGGTEGSSALTPPPVPLLGTVPGPVTVTVPPPLGGARSTHSHTEGAGTTQGGAQSERPHDDPAAQPSTGSASLGWRPPPAGALNGAAR